MYISLKLKLVKFPSSLDCFLITFSFYRSKKWVRGYTQSTITLSMIRLWYIGFRCTHWYIWRYSWIWLYRLLVLYYIQQQQQWQEQLWLRSTQLPCSLGSLHRGIKKWECTAFFCVEQSNSTAVLRTVHQNALPPYKIVVIFKDNSNDFKLSTNMNC